MAGSATTDEIAWLRAFLDGEREQSLTRGDLVAVIEKAVLPMKEPFKTTHKVVFTNPTTADRDIHETIASLPPAWERLTFIMAGGFCRGGMEEGGGHYSTGDVFKSNLWSFFADGDGREIAPGALLWELRLAAGNGGRRTVDKMRATVFATEDDHERSLDNLYVDFFNDRLAFRCTGLGLDLPNFNRRFTSITIEAEDTVKAPIFAFGHLLDCVQADVLEGMDGDGDIDAALVLGGTGLNRHRETGDADKAWGDLGRLRDIFDWPTTDIRIRRRARPTFVQTGTWVG